MTEEKLTTSQLEKKLLDREMKEICEGIEKVGEQLRQVFRKYEPLTGQFGKELRKFLIEHLRLAQDRYYAGYTTEVMAYVHPSWIPDGLKKAILEWAIKDFIEKVETIEEIAQQQE